jgi:hypothetical protein
LIGETGFPERPIEKFTGAIAGKHAASSIGAVRSWGKADDKEARLRIPETGYRPAPIRLAAIGAPLDAADRFPVCHQAGTEETVDNLLIEHLKLCQKTAPAQRL